MVEYTQLMCEGLESTYRDYTDKYFLRSKQILEAENINPVVRYQVFARQDIKSLVGVNKAVDFIKRKTPYIPVILFGSAEDLTKISGADIYLPYYEKENKFTMINFFDLVVKNAGNYLKNFVTLRKLTTKMAK